MLNRRDFLAATALAAFVSRTDAADLTPWRVAVIGHTGRGNYGHGIDTVWLKVPETQIVAVSDPDEKGRTAALARLKVDKGYADFRAMLAEIKPDLVAVGPRFIDGHFDMLMAATEAGVKGIYVEKPFCASPAEADKLLAAMDQRGTRCAVAHRNRYHPAVATAAKLVKEGLIGRLLEVRCRGKEDQRGGPEDLWVLGTHLFNLAVIFAGNPVACTATMLQDGKPAGKADLRAGGDGLAHLIGNAVHARFETESGVPIHFDSIKAAGTKTAGFGVQLIGTEGIVDFRIDEQPAAQVLLGSPFRPTDKLRAWVPITSAGVGQPEPIADIAAQIGGHIAPVRDLIAAIKENRQPLCSARDAALTIEMVTAVFQSHVQNGQRVTFPPKNRENPLTAL